MTSLGMLIRMFKYNTLWVLPECYRIPLRVLKSGVMAKLKDCYNQTLRVLITNPQKKALKMELWLNSEFIVVHVVNCRNLGGCYFYFKDFSVTPRLQ